jgi:hypothetical protein
MLSQAYKKKKTYLLKFFPYKFKWIDHENFLIIFNKCILIFRIRFKKNKILQKLKYSTKDFFISILTSDLLKEKQILIASGNNGNFYLKSLNSFNFIQIFFLNYIIIGFKKDVCCEEIIFAVGNPRDNNSFSCNLKKNFFFLILNLEEGKFIKIFNFLDYEFNESLFFVDRKNKIIILVFGKKLILFKLNFLRKKIHVRTIPHLFEIITLDLISNYLVFGDKNGEIFIFGSDYTNFVEKNKIPKFFILKKINTFLDNSLINYISFLNKKNIFFNILHNSVLFIIDINKKKKKLFFFLKKNEFFLSIKKNRKMMMLILTNKNMFLFFLKKQKILILSFHKLNQIKFFRRFELSKIQKFIKIKIFLLLFFSKFLFGIA